jgi:glycosyltransferase involved in cell wall biosynthesis
MDGADWPSRRAGHAADISAGGDDAARLADELTAICRETEAALDDLRRLTLRYQEVQQDSAATVAKIAAIRASNSWRALEAARRLRARLWTRPAPAAAPAAGFSRRRTGVPAFVRTAPLGVNVAGYLDTESGMGEAARGSIRSLAAAGIPTALNNVASRLRKQDRTFAASFTDAHPHPFNLVHLNADNMGWFAEQRGAGYFADRYTIGYWFWELSAFRDEWLPFYDYVDEVWAASEFMREAFAARSPVPVVRVPLPVSLPELPSLGRDHFGLPPAATVFLYMFDVSSQMERKNPRGAIEAFRRARFAAGEAVLVLKFTNAEYDREAVRRLRDAADGLPVRFFDGYMGRSEVAALVGASDCYLSPHRSEGFGLTMLEAMALGKPVIATAYSGNMDFMTAENSYLLPFRLATLEHDYGPYMRGAVWADPDLDEAARFMRIVAGSPEAARARGRRAQREVTASRDPQVTGAAVRARLDAIRAEDPA